MNDPDDKEWRGFAGGVEPTPVLKLLCFVCGNEDLAVEKCKVWCRRCHALIENCSGD
jgi:hypothetical protein